jgi:hypothetical protein
MKPPRTPRPGAQRGAAALIVVMLLFFIVSLVAAYAGRNLIFEQKTSANQYRATQAFEAAGAGREWAVAMLNGGRIDANCAASTDVAQPSFRQRFLVIDSATGNYTPQTWPDASTPERLRPSCVRSDTGWNCSCPQAAEPTLVSPAGAGIYPAFRVCFEAVNPPQPGVVRVVATGGTSFTIIDRPCQEGGEGTAGDAAASVSVVVGLSSALASPPMAAVTAGGNLSNVAGTTELTLVNTDPAANGLTANLGGSLPSWPFDLSRVTVPGSSISRSSVENDAALAALSPQQLFTSVFRIHPDTFKNQPAAVVLNDCAATCRNKLLEAVEANPGRIVWVHGDLALESALDLDTVDPPALIVASGNVNIYARARIRGVLVSLGQISNYAADTRIHGAVVAAGNVQNFGTGTTIEYDPAVVKQLRLAGGSLVRVPGSWRDFP